MTASTHPKRKPARLAVQVFETLKRDIISGTLIPNSQLSEAELSEHLGVSRTPVREALIKLAEDGLVKIVSHVGTFVAPISVESVREAQFIREHLECALISDACKRMDQSTLTQLREIISRQTDAAATEDWKTFSVLDLNLHETLASIAGHPGAWRVIQQSKVHLDRVRLMSFQMPAHMKQIIGQHVMIVEALARRDEGSARAALRIHLREILITLERLGLEKTAQAS
jgi:DNA-binding GntR family transcriptional regulator